MAEQAPWPCQKLRAALAKAATDATPASPAVLVATGRMGPAHLGHLQMLWQAKERLKRAGYEVLAGWLSPCNDLKAAAGQSPNESRPVLSSAFRLRSAELACKGDDLVSVSSWEARMTERAASSQEVIAALRAALTSELANASWLNNLRIFAVCGSNDVRLFQRISTSKDAIQGRAMQGLVVVPQPDDEAVLERAHELIYVADARTDRVAALSCTKLRKALNAGDSAFVIQATPDGEAQFLLDPPGEVRTEFAADFAKLAVEPEGSWPIKKLMDRLRLVAGSKYPAVLVATGAMSPTHRGHVLMMWQAKARLERAGYAVVSGWLTPWGDAAAQKEAQDKSAPHLTAAFRQKVAELSVCDDDFISVGSWAPGQQDASTKPQDACLELQRYLTGRFCGSFEGQTVRVFFVCGTDVADSVKLWSGIAPQHEIGVVVVPRDGEEPCLEVPAQLVFVADASPGEGAAALSSTRLRAAIKEANVASASTAMAPAAARYVLAATSNERAEMQADYAALGVQSIEPVDLEQAIGKLKETLSAWAGPQGAVHTDDLARLLHFIDPSWTSKEMTSLLIGAKVSADGFVAPDEFIDWLFTRCRA